MKKLFGIGTLSLMLFFIISLSSFSEHILETSIQGADPDIKSQPSETNDKKSRALEDITEGASIEGALAPNTSQERFGWIDDEDVRDHLTLGDGTRVLLKHRVAYFIEVVAASILEGGEDCYFFRSYPIVGSDGTEAVLIQGHGFSEVSWSGPFSDMKEFVALQKSDGWIMSIREFAERSLPRQLRVLRGA